MDPTTGIYLFSSRYIRLFLSLLNATPFKAHWFVIHRPIKRLTVKSSVQWLDECYNVASTTIT